MYRTRLTAAIAMLCLQTLLARAGAEPPFWGTIFVAPHTIIADDPSAFTRMTYIGQDERGLFDRRHPKGWSMSPAHLYRVEYGGERTIEFQVNLEFSRSEADILVREYAHMVGQAPRVLRANLNSVTIHDGLRPFGGGNQNMVVHLGQAKEYARDGILEETILHELSHASLDPIIPPADWRKAQLADGGFISGYARENPNSEDIAESFPLYLAAVYRRHRLPPETYRKIVETMPERIRYFERQRYDLAPFD